MMHIYRINLVGSKNNCTGPEERANISHFYPVQVDFPSGQVTFHSHLLNVQGIRQVICQLNHLKSKLDILRESLGAICPKLKLEFKFF